MSAICLKRFKSSNSGIVAIEFAIILPVFLLLLFGMIELGVWFLRYQTVSRTVSTTSASLQATPTDPGDSIKTAAYNSGPPLVDYNTKDNFVCAVTSLTPPASTPCKNAEWKLTPPTDKSTGKPATTYWIGVSAHVTQQALTPGVSFGMSMLPDMTSSAVFEVEQSASTSMAWVDVGNVVQTPMNGGWVTYSYNESPGEFCKANKYTFATGACRIAAGAPGYYGTLQANNVSYGGLNGWHWGCVFGNGAYWMDSKTQILCAK